MSTESQCSNYSNHEKRLKHLESKTRHMYVVSALNSVAIIVLAVLARRNTVVVINNTPKSQ